VTISLTDLIGKEIVALIPFLDSKELQKVKLINVETSGLWVESKALQEWAVEGTHHAVTPKTAVVFLPFSQIVAVIDSLDVPWISDKVMQ
jgi:hypothetical protein